MKTVLIFLFMFIFFCSVPAVVAEPLTGTVHEEGYMRQRSGVVVDANTGRPIPNANVEIPSKGVSAQTDGAGRFSFNASLDGPIIMSVQANGYRPFSLTVTDTSSQNPLVLEIQKRTEREIVIDTGLHHLGDDNYSDLSADADHFKEKASGIMFMKKFFVPQINPNSRVVLRIGSIVGLDTLMARKLGQSKTTNAYSSPMTVYLNSEKIGQLKINGDNQEILIPTEMLKQNSTNEIMLETGYNLFSPKRDYDDMEFMNLILEFR